MSNITIELKGKQITLTLEEFRQLRELFKDSPSEVTVGPKWLQDLDIRQK